MLDRFEWECPKCGDVMRGQGPASLNWSRTNHEWEHEREEKQQRSIAMPGAGAAPTHDPLMFRGLAILDDAFYDGARLTTYDRTMLKAFSTCWNGPKK